jgi:FAD/FMN-containing dehydrogenase
MADTRRDPACPQCEESISMSAFPGQPPAFRPADIARLRESVDGDVSAPGEDGYDVEGFNTNLAQQPALVVSARNAEDVRKAVEFGAAAGVPVAVQATGHGAIAANGALLINTRHLRTVSVDPQRRTARVAAGARWHDAVDAAAQHGLAPLNGTALSAGVVGYTLGGGLSPLSRAFGFASDHLRSAELVAADGTVRRVTADSDPDLLWALRGAKGNLGIVTELEFGLFPVPGIYAGGLYFPGDLASQALTAWSAWAAAAPEAVTSSFALLRLPAAPAFPEPLRGTLTVHIRVACLGSAEEGESLAGPLRAIGTPLTGTLADMPYPRIGTVFAVNGKSPARAPYHDRSVLLGDLPEAAARALLDKAGPDADCPLLIVELRHLGGALDRTSPDTSPISTDGAQFLLSSTGVGGMEHASRFKTYQAALADAMAPWTPGRKALNFLSGDETAPDIVAGAYAPEAYKRLATVKRELDPHNVFRVNHNIPPAAA